MTTFSYDGYLDLISTLRPLLRGQHDPTFQLAQTTCWRATRTPEGPATLYIAHPAQGVVEAEAWGPGANWVLERVPSMLALTTPGPSVAELTTNEIHSVIYDVVSHNEGMRLARIQPLFEVAVATVLGQFAPFARHRGRVQRWLERSGKRAPRYGPRRAVRRLDRPGYRRGPTNRFRP